MSDVEPTPERPTNTWRVCNHLIDLDAPHWGCTCEPWGPTAGQAVAARKRLAGEL